MKLLKLSEKESTKPGEFTGKAVKDSQEVFSGKFTDQDPSTGAYIISGKSLSPTKRETNHLLGFTAEAEKARAEFQKENVIFFKADNVEDDGPDDKS